MKTCETGPTVYRPYPRRLETFADVLTNSLFVCLFVFFLLLFRSASLVCRLVFFFFFPFICLFRTVSLSGRLAGNFFVVLLVF